MFKVKSRFPDAYQDQEIASFKFSNDAKLFIESKLRQDAGINKIIYKLFDFDDLIEEFDPKKLNASSTESQPSSNTSQTSSSGSRPSPFARSPTPPGTAKKWFQEDEEDGKKK